MSTIYVFCPEEPELKIMASGQLRDFRNGRFAIDTEAPDGRALAQFFLNQLGRFIVSDNLGDPALQAELHRRNIETFGRRADASVNSVTRDAQLATAIQLSRTVDEVASNFTVVDAQVMAERLAGANLPKSLAMDATGRAAWEAAQQQDDDRELVAAAVAQAGNADELQVPPVAEQQSSEDNLPTNWPTPAVDEAPEEPRPAAFV